MNHMKTLGIIGGLGPLATARFYERVVKATPAKEDQGHFDTLIFSCCSTPKRVEFIQGLSDISPAPKLIHTARELEKAGADVLVMPCITAHYFYDEIRSEVRVPFLNAIQLTGRELKRRGIRAVSILGTRATVDSGFIGRYLEEEGVQVIGLKDDMQDIIDRIIFGEIKQNLPPDVEGFRRVTESALSKGSEMNLIACTELSLITDENEVPCCMDMMDILAKAAVRECMCLPEDPSFWEVSHK